MLTGDGSGRCQGSAVYKVAARFARALIVVPTAASVPWCSELSRYGLARLAAVERLV
jgi:hypothetical protein